MAAREQPAAPSLGLWLFIPGPSVPSFRGNHLHGNLQPPGSASELLSRPQDLGKWLSGGPWLPALPGGEGWRWAWREGGGPSPVSPRPPRGFVWLKKGWLELSRCGKSAGGGGWVEVAPAGTLPWVGDTSGCPGWSGCPWGHRMRKKLGGGLGQSTTTPDPDFPSYLGEQQVEMGTLSPPGAGFGAGVTTWTGREHKGSCELCWGCLAKGAAGNGSVLQ